MPITNSTNLGFPIPGATSDDTRLGDMQAAKAALIALDANAIKFGFEVGNYAILGTVGFPVITIQIGQVYTVEAGALRYSDSIPAGNKFIPEGQVWEFLGGNGGNSLAMWKRIS